MLVAFPIVGLKGVGAGIGATFESHYPKPGIVEPVLFRV